MRAQHNLGATLHALFWIFLPDWIALWFWFPDTPGPFGFCWWCACGSISRSLWCRVCGFGCNLDLHVHGCFGLVYSFLFSAPFWQSERCRPTCLGPFHVSGLCGVCGFRLGLFTCTGLLGWWWGRRCLFICHGRNIHRRDFCFPCRRRSCRLLRGRLARGSGGTGAISSPPCNSRHTCSRLTSVWFSRCSPS
jgi:hypothetical protein